LCSIRNNGTTQLLVRGNGDVVLLTGDIYTAPLTDWTASASITGLTSTASFWIKYKKSGHLVHIWFTLTGTASGTSFNFTLPYTRVSPPYEQDSPTCGVIDNSVAKNGYVVLTSTQAVLYACINGTSYTSTWTNSGTRASSGYFVYEATT
jgi:hypothetical protein